MTIVYVELASSSVVMSLYLHKMMTKIFLSVSKMKRPTGPRKFEFHRFFFRNFCSIHMEQWDPLNTPS